MDEQQDRLDLLLDQALKSYGQAPQNEGLEQRILVRAQSVRVWYPLTSLLLAASAALFVGIAYLFWAVTPKIQTRPPATTPLLVQKRIGQAPLQATPDSPRRVALKKVFKRREARKVPAAPRLAQFPTPSPMTSEEEALVRLVTGKTEYIPKELMNLGGAVAPIEITALEVKPLRSGAEHEGEKCCDQ